MEARCLIFMDRVKFGAWLFAAIGFNLLLAIFWPITLACWVAGYLAEKVVLAQLANEKAKGKVNEQT